MDTQDDLNKYVPQNLHLPILSTLFDVALEGVWIGGPDHTTRYSNKAFSKLIGYSMDDIIGMPNRQMFDDENWNIILNENNKRTRNLSTTYHVDLLRKDGTNVPLLLSGAPLPDGGTIGIMYDITELKETRAEARELARLNKIKDEFISIVSHELRTPLTIIKGYLSILIDDKSNALSDSEQECINEAYRSSEQLINLVNDILDLSRIQLGREKINVKDFDFTNLCKKIVQDFQLIAEPKNIAIQVHSVGQIQAKNDANKIERVLINLIGNAIKHTPTGGKINVYVQEKESDTKGIPCNLIVVKIKDTGPGIPIDNLDKIFDKFYQAKESSLGALEGVGLGLNIVKNIVEYLGGKVSVESKEGHGSTFSFAIPSNFNPALSASSTDK